MLFIIKTLLCFSSSTTSSSSSPSPLLLFITKTPVTGGGWLVELRSDMDSQFGAPVASIAAVPGDSYTTTTDLSGPFTAKTHLLGLRVYVILAIAAGILAAALGTCILCCLRRQNNPKKNRSSRVKQAPTSSGLLLPKTNAAGRDAGGAARQYQLQVVSDAASTSSAGGTSSWSPAMSVGCGKRGLTTSCGWGRWYEMAEVEAATEGFKAENVIGEGGYGIVYKGLLPDGEVVAVKDLFDNK